MQLKQVGIIIAGCAIVAAVAFSCGEKKDGDKDDKPTADGANQLENPA
jgi:hypothetical protein